MFLHCKLKQTKDLKLISILIICLSGFINFSECLYEDQIGKFDWTNHYVGKIIDGYLDDKQNQIIVSTEENVLASLNTETGSVIWRQVLEKGDRGTIKLLHLLYDNLYNPNDRNSIRLNDRNEGGQVITVTGTNLVLVRGWNLRNGNLIWEWVLTPNANNQKDSTPYWFYDNTLLYSVVAVWKSHLEVVAYNARTGQQDSSATIKASISSYQSENCDFVKSYLVCIDNNNNDVISIDLKSGKIEVIGKSKPGERHRLVKGTEPLIQIGNKVYNLETKTNLPFDVSTNILNLSTFKNGQNILSEVTIDNSIIKVKVNNAETGDTLTSFESNYPDHLDEPSIFAVSCKTNRKSELVCKTLLSTQNGAIVQLQSGKIKWIREESLAQVAAIEIVDLPLSDNEGAIEKQLKNKNGDIFGNFLQRISTQINHVQHLLRTLFDVVSTKSIPKHGELTRDAFGLHTIIVVVSSTGKVFGIDNITGKHHYVIYLPNFTGFNNGQQMKLITQRTSKHFPHPAQCTILARHKKTGNGIIYQFNPITGKSINGGIIELNYEIRQVSVLQPSADFLKPILLFDKNNQLHVIPETSTELAHGTYIYSANNENGIVTGYYVEYNKQKKQLSALETWRINLSGIDNSQKIISIASKNPIEHVHSQGRVLNDRSVLYKYINPNLVAIVTQGLDNIYKYVLNVHLVDVVSGAVVSTINHRRVRGPVNIVHSENWLVYTYYNDKVRRTELTAIELYEGNTQANSTVWSSLDAPPLPVVEQQAYIIPANVLSLKETITEKGITHKHVLMALSNGGILEMPWHFLDPRRPVLGMNQPREEGTIPYIPELPLSSESIINYNQSISRIQGIYTAPSGLESTCLVVAYGLDFFVTRVAPSKTYDLLKEDFDYFLITSVLLGLIIASFVVKHMSAKKTLKQAWK